MIELRSDGALDIWFQIHPDHRAGRVPVGNRAGERIFGVLDASSCGVASQCTGVLAVQALAVAGKSAVGEVLPDFTGFRMLPINAGSGRPMGLSDLRSIAARGQVTVIGVIGPADAGKTSFLTALYLLLLRGQQLGPYRFAGSWTLEAWESLAFYTRPTAE